MSWTWTPRLGPKRKPPGAAELHEFRNPSSHENEQDLTADHSLPQDEQDDTGFSEGAV